MGKSGEQKTDFRTHLSPWRFLIIICGGIFLAEIAATLIAAQFNTHPYYLQPLLDASIIIILVFPPAYYLFLRPLFAYIEKFKQADDELRKSEERLRRVNRALTVLNECNQVLVRADDESELLQQMCEVIVNTGEYRMAWVGVAEQDEARSIRPVAQVGFDDGYLGLAQISWADNERGRGPTGTAVRDGVTQVNQNFLTSPQMAPWRETALSRGDQSSIALPLIADNSTFGALTIYSTAPDAFDADEVHLLNELASDLAFGIDALHVRAAHKLDEEKLRKSYEQLEQHVEERTEELRRAISKLEKAIIHSKQAESDLIKATCEVENNKAILDAVIQQMPAGIILTDASGATAKNNAAMDRIWRREMLPAENIESHGYVAYHPDGREYQWNEWPLSRSLLNGEEIIGEEMIILRGDGSKGIVIVSSAPIKDKNGQLIAGVVVDVDITERKLAEDALHSNEATLRGILDATTESIWTFNPDGRVLMANETALLRLHRPAAEIIGENFSKFMPSEELARTRLGYLKEVVETGQRLEKEDERAGIFFHHTYYPVKDANGCVTQVVTFSRDITQARLHSEALRESEQRFRLLFETMLQGVVYQDADGNIISMNPAAEQILGKSREEFLGSSSVKEAHDTIREDGTPYPGLEHPAMISLQTGEKVRETVMGVYNPRLPGYRWINLDSIPIIRPGENKPHQVYTLFSDITERKQAEELLRQSEARYRSLFNGMTEGFALHEIVCDENGRPCDYRFIEINPAFERLTGLRQENVVGRLVKEILPETEPYWIEIYGKVALTGRPAHFENFSAMLNRYYEVFAYSPAPRQFAVLFVNVSERKLAEEKIQATNEELTRFNQVMVGRELRMIELKREINALCGQVGQPQRYSLEFEKEGS